MSNIGVGEESGENIAKLTSRFRELLEAVGYSEDELNQIEEEIIGAIIGEIKSGNNTFTTEVGRYPYTQGMEGYTARLGLDESAGDTIRVSAGLAELFRGDFDGDKFRMALKVYEQYGEDEKLAEDYILKYNDTVASIMN